MSADADLPVAEYPRPTLPPAGSGCSWLVHPVPGTTFPSTKENTRVANRATGSTQLGNPRAAGTGLGCTFPGPRTCRTSEKRISGTGTDAGEPRGEKSQPPKPADTAAHRTAASTAVGRRHGPAPHPAQTQHGRPTGRAPPVPPRPTSRTAEGGRVGRRVTAQRREAALTPGLGEALRGPLPQTQGAGGPHAMSDLAPPPRSAQTVAEVRERSSFKGEVTWKRTDCPPETTSATAASCQDTHTHASLALRLTCVQCALECTIGRAEGVLFLS